MKNSLWCHKLIFYSSIVARERHLVSDDDLQFFFIEEENSRSIDRSHDH